MHELQNICCTCGVEGKPLQFQSKFFTSSNVSSGKLSYIMKKNTFKSLVEVSLDNTKNIQKTKCIKSWRHVHK